jgi:hypothetical protein
MRRYPRTDVAKPTDEPGVWCRPDRAFIALCAPLIIAKTLGTVPVHVDIREGRILSDDTELLQQRVIKQTQKLEQARTVVELTQARLDAASAAHEESERERKRKESALELATSRAKRLAKETKRARRLSEAVMQDRADAENELAEHLQAQEKRQAKLAKAEAALAAARATQDVEQAATRTTAPRKRSAGTAKKTPAKKTPGTKATAKKATAKKATTKKATTRRS